MSETPSEISDLRRELSETRRELDEARQQLQAARERARSLQATEHRFRTLFEGSPDAMIAFDTETLLPLELNALATTLFGYAPEELRETTWLALESAEAPKMTRAHVDAILRGRSDQFTTRIRRKDGEVRDVMVSVQSTLLDGRTVLLSFVRDITKTKLADEAVRRSETQVRLIADNLPAVVAYVGKDRRFRFVNRRFEEWFAVRQEEILGRHVAAALGTERYERIRGDFDRVLGGEAFSIETWTELPGGERRWTLDKYVPDFGPDGVRAFFLLVIDLTERKQAEEALLEHGKRLAEAQRIGRMGTWIWRLEEEKVEWTDEVYRMFGVSRESFVPSFDSVLELVHPDDRDFVRRRVQVAISERTTFTSDHQILLPSGEVRTVHAHAEVEVDRRGKAVRLTGTVQDITERKRIELALREQSERFSFLLESLPLVSYSCRFDAEIDLLYVSQRVFEVTGFTAEQMLEKPVSFLSRIHPEDRPLVRSALERIREVPSLQLEFRWKHADGHFVWLLNYFRSVQRDGAGEDYIVGVCQDITERRKADAVLKLQSQIIDQVHDAVVVAQLDGRISLWNGGAARLYGWTGEEIIGRHLALLYPDLDEPALEEALLRPLRSQRYFEQKSWNRTRSGKPVYVQQSFSLVSDEHGQPTGLIAYAIDITERKEAEDRAKLHLEELARVARLSTLGEMTTGLAHEINQPLAAIGTFAAAAEVMLANGSLDRHELLQIVRDISEQSHRAGRIIRRLRDHIRRSEPEKNAIDAAELVEGVIELISGDAKFRGIDLIVEHDLEPLGVSGDVIQLEQVLVNLINNSFDAVAEREDRQVRIATRRRGDDQVEFEVRDNGCGFGAEGPDRIFDAFFTNKEHGMGMGLAICRSIVEDHGGQLRAAESPGGGAILRFVLPRLVDQGTSEVQEKPAVASPQAKKVRRRHGSRRR
ncbi:MAG: PAS domain S-box protein [Planctomycetota bacterium]